MAAAVDAAPGKARRVRSLPTLSARHLLVVVLAVGAAVANVAVLASADRTMEVLVVAADLPAGTTVDAGSFTTARLSAASGLADRLVGPEALAGLFGSVTVRPLVAGDPLLAGDLLAPGAGGLRSMSVPVTSEVAVAGSLRVGDRVDVVAVVDGTARFLAVDLEVVAVPAADEFGGTRYAPTVAVGATPALRLAAALEVGGVHLVRSTGAHPITEGVADPEAADG
jgi:pilus assembly protein CpaB